MRASSVIHVAGISGSLRKGSYNTALLRAAAELAPVDMRLEIVDIASLPMFHPDTEHPFPQSVVEFRARLTQADAVLIATPEYNASISGALKNAIDWASRPPQSPWSGKPVAIMGASTGLFGTLRAQWHLRQILVHVGALPLGKPEVLVARAEQAFDSNGRLIDEAARAFVRALLLALADWVRKVAPIEQPAEALERAGG